MFQFSGKYSKVELLQSEGDLAYYLPKRALFSPTEIATILNIDITIVYSLISQIWMENNTSYIAKIHDKNAFFELNLYMKNQLLKDTDTFGMANSLEIRVPFLDRDLVDYVLRLEPEIKFGKWNKNLLVDATKDLIPQEIYKRKKKGFELPFDKWLNGDCSDFNISRRYTSLPKPKEMSWAKIWALFILEDFM